MTAAKNYAEWEADIRQRIAELTESITAQEAERRKLKRIIDYRTSHPSSPHVNGKKIKDMTVEEKREYNKIKARLSRQNRKNKT